MHFFPTTPPQQGQSTLKNDLFTLIGTQPEQSFSALLSARMETSDEGFGTQNFFSNQDVGLSNDWHVSARQEPDTAADQTDSRPVFNASAKTPLVNDAQALPSEKSAQPAEATPSEMHSAAAENASSSKESHNESSTMTQTAPPSPKTSVAEAAVSNTEDADTAKRIEETLDHMAAWAKEQDSDQAQEIAAQVEALRALLHQFRDSDSPTRQGQLAKTFGQGLQALGQAVSALALSIQTGADQKSAAQKGKQLSQEVGTLLQELTSSEKKNGKQPQMKLAHPASATQNEALPGESSQPQSKHGQATQSASGQGQPQAADESAQKQKVAEKAASEQKNAEFRQVSASGRGASDQSASVRNTVQSVAGASTAEQAGVPRNKDNHQSVQAKSDQSPAAQTASLQDAEAVADSDNHKAAHAARVRSEGETQNEGRRGSQQAGAERSAASRTAARDMVTSHEQTKTEQAKSPSRTAQEPGSKVVMPPEQHDGANGQVQKSEDQGVSAKAEHIVQDAVSKTSGEQQRVASATTGVGKEKSMLQATVRHEGADTRSHDQDAQSRSASDMAKDNGGRDARQGFFKTPDTARVLKADGAQNAGSKIKLDNEAAFSMQTSDAQGANRTLREASATSRSADVYRQVENGAFKNLGQGTKQLTIRLDPGELGQVNVILQIKGKEVHAVLRTTNQETTHALNEQMAQLRTHLESQGLKVSRLEVQTQLADSQGQSQWQGAEQHNRFQENRELAMSAQRLRTLDRRDVDVARDVQNTTQREKLSQSGVDIFA